MRVSLSVLALALLAIGATAVPAQMSAPKAETAFSTDFMLGTDMGRPVLYPFDIESERMITTDLTKDPKWPGGMPLHTVVTPDGRRAKVWSKADGFHMPHGNFIPGNLR